MLPVTSLFTPAVHLYDIIIEKSRKTLDLYATYGLILALRRESYDHK